MISNDASLLYKEAFMTVTVLGFVIVGALVLIAISSRGMQRSGRRRHLTSDGTMAFADGGSSDCGSDGGGCGDGGGGGGD